MKVFKLAAWRLPLLVAGVAVTMPFEVAVVWPPQ